MILLESFGARDPVLIDAATNTIVRVEDIGTRAKSLSGFAPSGALAFLLADNSLEAVRDFHSLLEAGIAVALVEAASDPATIRTLIAHYVPNLVVASSEATGALAPTAIPPDHHQIAPGVWLARARGNDVHSDLAVLLTTSGSTGSPKFVRLSRANIASNALQIAASLGIRASDRGITALPIHYSFGMSILTSHAAVGSPVVISNSSLLEPTLWEQVTQHGVTFFPGVPQTYQMLRRLRFHEKAPASIRALIQAGGRLDHTLVGEFANMMDARGGQFFVMYGQTEASPRIACLPPARLPEKLGSAGVALQDGHVEARDPQGDRLPPCQPGEIFYTGPNVMMGYADCREDLSYGDTQGDTLATGDLGYVDEEGFLFLTGRAKRIAKVAGLRISLDEVEAMLPEMHPIAVEAPSGTISLATLVPDIEGLHRQASRHLARELRVPPKSVRVTQIERVPLLSSGKIDYRALESLLGKAE